MYVRTFETVAVRLPVAGSLGTVAWQPQAVVAASAGGRVLVDHCCCSLPMTSQALTAGGYVNCNISELTLYSVQSHATWNNMKRFQL